MFLLCTKMKVCRICLCQAEDAKLYHISSNGLRSLYQQLTGVLDATDKILPQWVCAECGLRLLSYNKLRQKSLRACQILCQILEKETMITLKDINQIDREQNGLESNLSYTDSFPLRIYNRQEYFEDITETPKSPKTEQDYIKKIPETTKAVLECIQHPEMLEATQEYLDDMLETAEATMEYEEMSQLEDEFVDNDQHDQDVVENVQHNQDVVENVQHDQDVVENVQHCQEFTENYQHGQKFIENDQHGQKLAENVQHNQEFLEYVKETSQNEEEYIEYVPETTANISMIPETMETNYKVPQQIQEFVINSAGENIETHDYCFIQNLSDSEVYHVELEANSHLENDFPSLTKLESGSKLEVGLNLDNDSKLELVSIDSTANTKSNVILNIEGSYVEKLLKNQQIRQNHPGKARIDIGDVFAVNELSPEEVLVEFAKRKYSEKYRKAPFKCLDCFKGFMSQDAFDGHRVFHSETWGNFKCDLCKLRFQNRSSYLTHETGHKHQYKCKVCPFVSSQRSSVLQHRVRHIGKTYECPHCPEQFTAQSTFASHLRVKHVSTEFSCEFCGFSFISYLGLSRHKYLKHGGVIDIDDTSPDCRTCPTCNIKFASDKALQTHTNLTHISDEIENEMDAVTSIICELCGEVSPNGRSHRGHMRSHTNTVYTCHHCGVAVPTKGKLHEHMLLHDPRPYHCDLCDTKFTSRTNLRLHFDKKHAPNKKVYPCAVCGKHLSSAENRNRHMSTHSDLKPFECDHCDKAFKIKEMAKAHIMHVHMKVPRPWRKQRSRRS